MLVIKWNTDDEVIAMANATDYGLAMSVFARSPMRAERIVRAVHSGVGNVNDFGCNYLIQSLPFGGVKGSGFGRFAGPEGLRACCYTKVSDYFSLSFILWCLVFTGFHCPVWNWLVGVGCLCSMLRLPQTPVETNAVPSLLAPLPSPVVEPVLFLWP